ncbi:DNA-binding response regulator [Polaribacter pacificus]|uniref:DNA-binding response regulator n=1 Tax=Polaribacter pacificus TaxID=1775173 RepID=A0A917I1S5_9FLAO|nr:LytTR family DNA-binding domain-containing protein [Polaribacter pacificus]GGH01971.1 DNA-binding response regulator [Polaribacter pacificus]
MKVVLIEDEVLASEKLERYLEKYGSQISVVQKLTSISESVAWFLENHDYDLVFMDIQLIDGLSFEILNQVSIQKPIIFITAFDEYAIDAFKVNSIDYILKPITFTDISKALKKLKLMQSVLISNEVIEKVTKEYSEKKVKDRFLVRLGNHIHAINTKDIALFYAEGRTVFLMTNQQKKYIIEYTLENLIEILDSRAFYRVNRTFIVGYNSIHDLIVYSNSRLKISLKITLDKEVIVSREKVSDFKKWLEGV